MDERLEKIRDVIRPGDVILTKGKSLISRILQIILKNSHVGMVGDKFKIMHCTHPKTECIKLDKFVKNKKITVRRYIDISDNQTIAMLNAAADSVQKSIKYAHKAYGGLIPFNILEELGMRVRHLDNPWRIKNKAVCSTIYQLWSMVAEKTINRHLGKGQVTPDDILYSDQMRTVYKEGKNVK